jgi:hypothetical protein
MMPALDTGEGDGGQHEGNFVRLLRPDTGEGGEPQGSRKRRPRYPLEGRGEQAYVSAERRHNRDSEPGSIMCTDIDRISVLAKEDPQRQFFSIAHLLTPGELYVAFQCLRREASAGIDGVTHEEYEKNAEGNIRELHQRLKDG